MPDVIPIIRTALEPAIEPLARTLNESPGAVRKGFQALFPGVLSSLAALSQTDEGAETVRLALQDAQTRPEMLDALPARLDGVRLKGRASGAGTRLLGDRGPMLEQHLAPWAGLKPASAAVLVDLAVPIVLAGVRRAQPRIPDAAKLRTFFSGQEPSVTRAMPSGFNPFPRAAGAPAHVPAPPSRALALPARRTLLWWLVGVIALVVVLFGLLSTLRGGGATPTSAPPESSVGASSAGPSAGPSSGGGAPSTAPPAAPNPS